MTGVSVAVIYLANADLDSPFCGWSLYNCDDEHPPFADISSALREGWRLVQVSSVHGGVADSESPTYLRHEVILEKSGERS